MSSLQDIQRRTNGLTDWLADKGDYYGPRRVNPESKIKTTVSVFF